MDEQKSADQVEAIVDNFRRKRAACFSWRVNCGSDRSEE